MTTLPTVATAAVADLIVLENESSDVCLQNLTTVQHSFGSYTLQTVATATVEDYLLQKKEGETACGVVKAISGHSDLVAGQYEGRDSMS